MDMILKDNPNMFEENLEYQDGQTLNFNLIGSYSKNEIVSGVKVNPKKIFQQYEDYYVFEKKIPKDIAKHLVKTYGTTSLKVIEQGTDNENAMKRLHKDFPFVECEVLYGIRHEMAIKPNDIVCRRVPISFIHTEVTSKDVLPRVVEIMGNEFEWSEERRS